MGTKAVSNEYLQCNTYVLSKYNKEISILIRAQNYNASLKFTLPSSFLTPVLGGYLKVKKTLA